MKRKKVIVACGSGVATSQTVASKIESMCENASIPVSVEPVDIKSLENIIGQCDVYVSIVPMGTKDWGKPTISGIPFLTGIGIDAEFDKLKEFLLK